MDTLYILKLANYIDFYFFDMRAIYFSTVKYNSKQDKVIFKIDSNGLSYQIRINDIKQELSGIIDLKEIEFKCNSMKLTKEQVFIIYKGLSKRMYNLIRRV